ncbi:MAG: fucose-binding lectin II [Conexibacter sp.]
MTAEQHPATPPPDPTNESIVYLPYATPVNVHAFSSAGRLQQITLRPEGMPPIEFIGNGTNDKPLGQTVIVTPAQGPQPHYQVLVHIQSTRDGRAWTPSALVVARQIQAMAYTLILVASEDKVDANWSDATLMFTWSAPIAPG